jgi:predicted membrane GTPase involved in stress response
MHEISELPFMMGKCIRLTQMKFHLNWQVNIRLVKDLKKRGLNCSSQFIMLKFVPEERMGEVITDLQGRRAMILGMEGEGIYQRLKAKVPLAEMNKYSTTLSSLSNGRASYSMKFNGYEVMPPDIQDKVIKEYEESQKEEE